jgi:antitoxin VapB
METAKLFQNGSSQVVRLPKSFRIPGNEVKIFKKGNQVILEPIETTWDLLFESLSEFPEDFMKDGRNQLAYTSLKNTHRRFLSDSGNILHRMLQSPQSPCSNFNMGSKKANTGNVPRMLSPNFFCH